MADETMGAACGRCGRAMRTTLPVCPKCMAHDPQADELAALRARVEELQTCLRVREDWTTWAGAKLERYRKALETADKAVQASERLLAQDTRPLDIMTTDAYRAWREWRDTLTPALTAIAEALAATGDEEGKGGEGR